jgi:hypothetical protein
MASMLGLSTGQMAGFQALLLGFAFAGLLASAFQVVAHRPPSFRMLLGKDAAAFAALPLLAMTAPVIILRNSLRGRRFERRPIGFVALATIIACLWSMALGATVLKLASGMLS